MLETIGSLRILVADDDCVVAKTLAQILRLSGYDAETAGSGEEAIAAAAKYRPDVLISDVVMGGITGIEAAIRILTIVPACRVILVSGQAHMADHVDAARCKGHEFEILSKPVHPKVLLGLIAALATQRRFESIDPDFQANVGY